MAISRHLQKFVSDLQIIDEQILLKLPASIESVQLQLQRIRYQHRRLERAWREAPRLQRQYRRSPEQDLWQRAWEVAKAMLLYVEMLIDLAEEHGADPAGTVTCLSSIQTYRQSYLQMLTNLQEAIAHFRSNSPIHQKLQRWRNNFLVSPSTRLKERKRSLGVWP